MGMNHVAERECSSFGSLFSQYSGTSQILTVTWLSFHCVVSFCKIQKAERVGWRHCRNRVTWLDFCCVVSFWTIQKAERVGWRHCRNRVTWLDFCCVVSFCTIQKTERAGWRHCRNRVTWLDFYCVVSFWTIQKTERAGWRHCRNRVTWLDFYCVVSFCTIQKTERVGWRHCRNRVTWLDFCCVVSFWTIQKTERAGWRHCRNRVTWLDFYCVVSFWTIQKTERVGWRHCRNRVTWLSGYEVPLYSSSTVSHIHVASLSYRIQHLFRQSRQRSAQRNPQNGRQSLPVLRAVWTVHFPLFHGHSNQHDWTGRSHWRRGALHHHLRLRRLAQTLWTNRGYSRDWRCFRAPFGWQWRRGNRVLYCPAMFGHFSPAPHKNIIRCESNKPIKSNLTYRQSINQPRGLQWKSTLDWLI